MGKVLSLSSGREPPKSLQSRMETQYVTQPMVQGLEIPPFQRPLRVNDKVRAVTEQIRRDKVIEGVLTLGRLKGSSAVYIVHGQHRFEAFKLSGLDEVIADVRTITFETMADMANEFVRLNSSLVRMRPDDILRGLESSVTALEAIRKACPFVGYDQIRRSERAPIVSMSALIRSWTGSTMETPTAGASGASAATIAHDLSQQSVQNLVGFMSTAHAAWGRDPEYYRLWSNLNLTICMWMWNRLVIDRERVGGKRYVVLSIPQFKHCLMSVSADADYLEWLRGRNLTDRDRSPCYMRLKSIFVRRLSAEPDSRKVFLPSPAWSSK